jgi:hypothetical protein
VGISLQKCECVYKNRLIEYSTQTNFPFAINNVDATSKKPILIARLTKCKAVADYMEIGKSSFAFISETDPNFQNKLFTGELAFQLCTRLEKFACPSLKTKAGQVT